jgi:hypothetical protein
MLWLSEDKYVSIITGTRTDKTWGADYASYLLGSTVDVPVHNNSGSNPGLSALKLLAFLNSPYVDKTKHGIPRHIRRRAARQNLQAQKHSCDSDCVTVVELRQPAFKKFDGPGNGVVFKHRWWVRGHIRAQWIPSRKAHKLIYIAPYLKGPEDAPMIQRVYHVVQ